MCDRQKKENAQRSFYSKRQSREMDTDAIGQRIADLYRELSFPSAPKLQKALQKEGIKISLDELKNLTTETGARQIFRPPPTYKGHITATRLDNRWAADLMSFESHPVKRSGEAFTNVLLCQDIFSRYLWAEPVSNKTLVARAFGRILDRAKRKPRELSSDKGSEFSSREFQSMLARHDILWRAKEGQNDISTLDRAMGTLRLMINKRLADESSSGEDWLAALQPVLSGYNRLDHHALHDHAPNEVADNDALRFQLRHENATNMYENARAAEKRETKLESAGSFRTLLHPTAIKRRAGVANWSTQVHTVDKVSGAHVRDTEGNSFSTRLVMPVSAQSSGVKAGIHQGGSATKDAQRRIATERFLPALIYMVRNAGNAGLTISKAGRQMTRVDSFTRTLQAQRMTFRQFVDIFGHRFQIVGKGRAMKILESKDSEQAKITERADGTLLQFARLKRMRAE